RTPWPLRFVRIQGGHDSPGVGMAGVSCQTEQLQAWLDRRRARGAGARDQLLPPGYGPLPPPPRKLLHDHPGVRRWSQTDDVLHGALLRLLRALDEVRPASVRDFFALTTEEIRRELLDLARHYFGPQGVGANHATHAGEEGSASVPYDRADD